MYIYGGNNISDAIPDRLFLSSFFHPQTRHMYVGLTGELRSDI